MMYNNQHSKSRQGMSRQGNLSQVFGNGGAPTIFPGFGEHFRRTHIPAQPQKLSSGEIKDKKKKVAVKLLRKFLNSKLRDNFQQIKANALHYQNYRTQKKLRANMQLFKVASILQDKLKSNKFSAFANIRERALTKYQ